MKDARCIMKFVTALAAVGAVACLVVAYWDKILDVFYTVADKIEEKRANCAFCDPEFDDFADAEDTVAF